MKYISLFFRELLFTYRFVKPAHLVFTICALCVFCGKTPAQDFKQLHPGVEYAQVEHKLGSDPVKINLLRLDLKKVRLDVHHALDKAIGLETTSSIATRKGAVAAINAGFFRLDKSEWAGDAAGVLQIDGRLISESLNRRIAIGITNGSKRTRILFGHINAYAGIGYYRNGTRDFNGINREMKPGEIVLFTPEFGVTPAVEKDQTEIVFRGCDVGCQTADIVVGRGGTTVPANGYVVAISPTADSTYFVEHFQKEKGKPLTEHTSIFPVYTTNPGSNDRRFRKVEDITNGVPQLIKNGKIDITWEQEKASRSFAETRHPRTAVAKLKDGKFLMMTVDGRQPGVSVGMSLQELAEYLFSLGAVDAMNLDGGGSTTMFLDGKVVNKPSDPSGERKIGDAILVTLRKNR